MSIPEKMSFVRRVSQIGTLLQTFLCGKEVGRDAYGNRYYCERGKPQAKDGHRALQRRWVIYAGEPEPTKVPPEWFGWLHYTMDAPLPETPGRKPHTPNLTGTPDAWMPASLKGVGRTKAPGDYQAWKPE